MSHLVEDNEFKNKKSNNKDLQDTNASSSCDVVRLGSGDQPPEIYGQLRTEKVPDPVRMDGAVIEPVTAPPHGSPEKKRPPSEKIIARNQANTKHSTGPHDTRRTRYNALKHGLRAAGLTRFDNAEEYSETVDELNSQYPPCNGVERFQNERAALGVSRGRRIPRMEAEMIEALSNPSASCQNSDSDQCSPTIDPATMIAHAARTLNLLQRYDSDNLRSLLVLYGEIQRRDGESNTARLNLNYDIEGNVTI